MARVDFEAAWTELGAVIAEREGWGSKSLTLEMARIAGRHRVSEGLLERVLRMYGGRLQLLLSTNQAEAPPPDPGGTPTGLTEVPAPPIDRGGHDGYAALTGSNGAGR